MKEENVSTTETNNITSKNSNKIIPIVAVILVVIALFAGGFYYYFNKTDKIVTNVINKAFNKINDSIDEIENFDYNKDTALVNGSLKIDTNIDGLEDLKNEKFDYTFGMDYKNKKLELGAALTEDETKVIDALLYLINDKAYVSLKDDYKKIINIDSQEFDFDEIFKIENTDINKDDLKYISKEIKNILIDSIEMKKLTKSSSTIKLNGKSTKVTKISYNLNERNTKKLVENVIDNILDNDELLKKLSKISDTSVSDIEDALEDAKDEDIEAVGTLNLYTKGFTNEFAKLELINNDTKFGIINNSDNTVVYAKDDDANLEITVNENTKDKLSIDYLYKESNAKVDGTIKITNKEISKSKNEGSIELSVNYDKYKVNLDLDYKSEIGAKIADIDESKTVKLSEMTSTDLNDLYTKIMSKLNHSDMADIIKGISSSLPSLY